MEGGNHDPPGGSFASSDQSYQQDGVEENHEDNHCHEPTTGVNSNPSSGGTREGACIHYIPSARPGGGAQINFTVVSDESSTAHMTFKDMRSYPGPGIQANGAFSKEQRAELRDMADLAIAAPPEWNAGDHSPWKTDPTTSSAMGDNRNAEHTAKSASGEEETSDWSTQAEKVRPEASRERGTTAHKGAERHGASHQENGSGGANSNVTHTNARSFDESRQHNGDLIGEEAEDFFE